MINDILDLSKVEAAQLEIERTGFSLKDKLEKVIEMVAARAQEKGLALVSQIAPNMPNNVVGDPTRLRQVLLNLLGNAIKFTQSGEVSLRVAPCPESSSTSGMRFTFTVADTGIGIPDEKLDHVFERFAQADSSTTRRFGGSGLGLAISKRLVELMGGRIWVESEVGHGSVFAFTVPLEIWDANNRPEAVSSGTAPRLPLPSLKILLADDSPDTCTIMMAYLEHTPYRVEIAVNGAIACEKFTKGNYDLVLMDWQMPVMDGLTATGVIRAWEQANDRPPIPIIALTASALEGDKEKCLAAGCTGFLTKPIKQEVLLGSIREHSTVAPKLSKESSETSITPFVTHPFAKLIPGYLLNCRMNIIAMRGALDRIDLETVRSLGHRMGGTGAMYGFQFISDTGGAIEQAAVSSNIDVARDRVEKLSDYLDAIDSAWRAA